MLKTCAEVCRGVQMSSIAWAVWCVDFLSQLSSAKTKGLDPSLLDDQRFIFKSR